MASEESHIALANRNHATLLHLLPNAIEYPEWVATIAFYKAVQIVEAAFATTCLSHSTSHHQRLLTLKGERFKPVFREYRPLISASRIARYLEDFGDVDQNGKPIWIGPGAFNKFTEYMLPSEVADELVYGRLFKLEQNCLKFLTDDGRNRLLKIQKPPRAKESLPTS
jgi:hypothetical protein